MALTSKVVAFLTEVDSILSFVLVAFVAFLITALIYRQHAYWRKYSWPPGPKGWPVIGNSLLVGALNGPGEVAKITRIGRQCHPDVFTLTLHFGKRVIVLNSFKAMKEAFVQQSSVISNRPPYWAFRYANKSKTNVGLFFESFTNSWKREKKYMMRTVRHFGYGTQASQPLILREANHLADLIQKRGGEPFDLSRPLSLCMMNVTFSMIFSTTYEEDDKQFASLLIGIMNWFMSFVKNYDYEPFLPVVDKLGLSPRLRNGQRITKELLGFIRKHIDEHMATLDPSNPRDMTDECLIEMATKDPQSDLRPGEFDDENLQWMLLFFIVDQGDTSVGVFLFLMLVSASHPEVQERVFHEIQEVIGDRPPSLDDKARMPFTEAVILETLRMDTPFWFWIPHFTAVDVDLLGYKIPKGTSVVPNLAAVHFDPDLWGDPENFRPGRFIDEHGVVNKPDYLIPFSIGRRRCIGEHLAMKEFFLMYVTLIQKFKFKIPDGDTPPKLRSKWLEIYPEEYRLQAEPRCSSDGRR